MDISQLIDYYKNLLIVQYHGQPKAQATIEMYANAILTNGIAFDVRDAYDIDTATGAQLDVLGKYIGIDRYSVNTFVDGYFGFTDYNSSIVPSATERLIDEHGNYIIG